MADIPTTSGLSLRDLLALQHTPSGEDVSALVAILSEKATHDWEPYEIRAWARARLRYFEADVMLHRREEKPPKVTK